MKENKFTEEWKVIENSKNYYVSNMGNIKYEIDGDIKNIKPKLSNGYLRVNIPNSGTRWIHRLVALHFVEGNNSERNVVNHKDGNKLNNRFDNLEWVTALENSKKAGENGQLSYDRSKAYKGKILAIKSDNNNEIEELMILPNQRAFSKYTGIHTGSISRAISSNPNERKTTNKWTIYKI